MEVKEAVIEELKRRIALKFGCDIEESYQIKDLRKAIIEETKQMIGETTLKRIYGFVGLDQNIVPRILTLDILAQYIGYSNFKSFAKELGENPEISSFSLIESISAYDMEVGEKIRFTYKPDRKLLLTYLGNNEFVVDESHNSKLIQGDVLTINGNFLIGAELLINDVKRNGNHLGSYFAAKDGGLTDWELESI